jgi:hypothetical protein
MAGPGLIVCGQIIQNTLYCQSMLRIPQRDQSHTRQVPFGRPTIWSTVNLALPELFYIGLVNAVLHFVAKVRDALDSGCSSSLLSISNRSCAQLCKKRKKCVFVCPLSYISELLRPLERLSLFWIKMKQPSGMSPCDTEPRQGVFCSLIGFGAATWPWFLARCPLLFQAWPR